MTDKKTKLEKTFWKFDKKLEKLYNKSKEIETVLWSHQKPEQFLRTSVMDDKGNWIKIVYTPAGAKREKKEFPKKRVCMMCKQSYTVHNSSELLICNECIKKELENDS